MTTVQDGISENEAALVVLRTSHFLVELCAECIVVQKKK